MEHLGYTIVDKNGRPLSRRPVKAPKWRSRKETVSRGAIKVYDTAEAAKRQRSRLNGKIALVYIVYYDGDPEDIGLLPGQVWP